MANSRMTNANIDFTKFEYLKDDFSFIQNNVFGPKIDITNMKEYYPNLNADLMRYFFKNILQYNIAIAPIEKVYFSFTFTYKQHLCYISRMKLSYKLYCEESIKDELFKKFAEIGELIENAFIDFCDRQIKENEYTLPNDLWMFDKYIGFIQEKIIKYNEMIKQLGDQRFERKNEKSEGGTTYYVVDKLKFESEDLSISIINYIDFQFSKIEHLLSLLYPLLNDVKNDSDPYSKYLTSDYRSKIAICCPNIDSSIVDELSYIKEVHRNRFSHGLFSREKELDIKIPDFGSYYMSVGKKTKGFNHLKFFYNFNDYLNFNEIFEKFYNYLELTFPLQMKVINEGIPVNLDHTIYEDVFINENNTYLFIEKYNNLEYIVKNMEW